MNDNDTQNMGQLEKLALGDNDILLLVSEGVIRHEDFPHPTRASSGVAVSRIFTFTPEYGIVNVSAYVFGPRLEWLAEFNDELYVGGQDGVFMLGKTWLRKRPDMKVVTDSPTSSAQVFGDSLFLDTKDGVGYINRKGTLRNLHPLGQPIRSGGYIPNGMVAVNGSLLGVSMMGGVEDVLSGRGVSDYDANVKAACGHDGQLALWFNELTDSSVGLYRPVGGASPQTEFVQLASNGKKIPLTQDLARIAKGMGSINGVMFFYSPELRWSDGTLIAGRTLVNYPSTIEHVLPVRRETVEKIHGRTYRI